MQKNFWRLITQFGQLPLLLIWPLLLYVLAPGEYYFAIILLLALFMSHSGGALLKLLYHKPRPDGQTYSSWIQKISAGSMPSIHTSNMTVVIGFFLLYMMYAFLAQLYHPIALFLLSSIVTLFAFGVMLSRIELKKHYSIDILAGVAFGMIILLIVFWGIYLILW